MMPSQTRQILTGLTYMAGAALFGWIIGAAVATFLIDIEEAMESPPPKVTWPEFHAPAVPATRE